MKRWEGDQKNMNIIYPNKIEYMINKEVDFIEYSKNFSKKQNS